MKISMFLLFMNMIAKQLRLLTHATLYVVEVNKSSLSCSCFYVGEFHLNSLMSFRLLERKQYIDMITNNGALLCLR